MIKRVRTFIIRRQIEWFQHPLIEFKKNKEQVKKAKLKNIAALISNFEKRIERSIISLKEINKTKKLHDTKKMSLKKNHFFAARNQRRNKSP